jgi:hypothetical protein
VLFKPYEVHRQQRGDSILYLYQFVYKELDTNQTQMELHGQKGRYIANRLYVEEPIAIDWVKKERIAAKEGRYERGVLTFIGDVNYTSQEYIALAKRAIYDTKKEILHIPTTFWLYAKEMNVTGKRLVYYKSSGKIVAYDIDAKVLQ